MYSGRMVVAYALAGVALATRVAAQDEAALRRHAERLSAAYDRARALAAQRDTAQSQLIPVDTIRVGALRIVVAPSVTARARAGADSAWTLLSATFGHAADVVGRTTLVVWVADQPEGRIHALPPFADVMAPRGADGPVIAHRIVTQAAQLVSAHQDSTLQDWLRGTLIPPLAGARLDIAYEDLVTSPFSAAQRCFVGDRVACLAALGLSGMDDPILRWYDAIDRRLLAGRYRLIFARPAQRAALTRCSEGGSDSECVAALRPLSGTIVALNTPLEGANRISLAAVALDVGGRGAYERLAAAPRRPLAERLAAASRLPTDSLVAVWRARALAARPQPVTVDPRALWTAVLWGALFGVIALRSTRWR